MALNHCIKIVFCTKGRTVSRLNRILINGAMKSRPAKLTFPRPQPKRYDVFLNMLRREFVAIGIPPVGARTLSASSLIWLTSVQSECRGAENADVRGCKQRTCAILPCTLSPGKGPPVPVLAPCTPLKWNACTLCTFPDQSRTAPTPGRKSGG
jgi:hypothetical protein